MAEIKTDRNASELLIKIERRTCDALLITCATWRNLSGLSEIQWLRLNRNDLHLCISSELLIKD